MSEQPTGVGWILFAGIMMLIAGSLNVIYGIAALDNASFLVNGTHYVISDLHTWGWILVILGGLEILAAFSIWAGGQIGRWFGVFIAMLAAIGVLLGGSTNDHPFWALMIFIVDILIIYALVAYGGQRTVA